MNDEYRSSWSSKLLLRGWRSSRITKRVDDALKAGNVADARTILLCNIRRWRFNWEDGSRLSHVNDLNRLLWLLDKFAVIATTNDPSAPLLKTIEQDARSLRTFFLDTTNFRRDGRMIVPQKAAQCVKEQASLMEAIRKA